MRRLLPLALLLLAALALLAAVLLTRGPTARGDHAESARSRVAATGAAEVVVAPPTVTDAAAGRRGLDARGPDDGPAAAPRLDGRLEVRVVRDLDGAPLAAVPVEVIQQRAPGLDPADRIRHGATSDADGRATVPVESAIAWTVWVDHEPDRGGAFAAVVPLAPGEVRGIRIEVPTRGGLTWFGRVEHDGEPVAGATVELLQYDDDEENPEAIQTATSDAAGLIRFAATSFEPQDVHVHAPGLGLTYVEVLPGHDAPERAQSLPLWPMGALRATVVDAGGSPLPQIVVAVSAPAYLLAPPDVQSAYAGPVGGAATTDAEGVALLQDLPAELMFQIELRRGEETLLRETDALLLSAGSTAERRFMVGSEGTIDGQLLGLDGAPIDGAMIELFEDRNERARPQLHARPRGERANATSTDEAGRFRYDGVTYGHWFVAAVVPETTSNGYTLAQPVHISADSPAATVTLRVDPGHAIAGVVVDDDGVGLADVIVTSWSDTDGGGPQAKTDASGAFRLTPLTGGTFRVNVRAPRSFVNVVPVEVDAGTEDLVVQLTSGARVRGTVRDAWTGEPVEDVQIHAYAYDGERPHFPFSFAHARDGTFEVKGLPEGAIALKATSQRGHMGIATGIRVRRDAVEEVEIRVETGVPIRVRYAGTALGAHVIVTQDDATVTYIGVRPGESTTCQVLPGRATFRLELPDGTKIERIVDVGREGTSEVVLGE